MILNETEDAAIPQLSWRFVPCTNICGAHWRDERLTGGWRSHPRSEAKLQDRWVDRGECHEVDKPTTVDILTSHRPSRSDVLLDDVESHCIAMYIDSQ